MSDEAPIKLQAAVNQVGGHTVVQGKAATYTDEEGRFYKAGQGGHGRAERETKFYEEVQALVDSAKDAEELTTALKDALGLHKFLPGYFGKEMIGEQEFVVMEDICKKYEKPCVMDAKIGMTTAHEWLDEDKKAKNRAKDLESTQATLGFRFCGIQAYQVSTGEYIKPDRPFLRGLNADTISEGFTMFASTGVLTPADVYGGPNGAIAQLKSLEEWFESQRSFLFYAASVLIVYEGTATTAEEAKIAVRLIDFAHTFHADGKKDENFLEGLKSFISCVEKSF